MAQAWEQARRSWSPWLRLPPPQLSETVELAQFELARQQIWVNATALEKRGLLPWLSAILAHEIGHAVVLPGSLGPWQQLCARVAQELEPEQIPQAAQVVNLFADLVINTRLQRAGLPMLELLQQLQRSGPPLSPLGQWSARVYTWLWELPEEALHLPLSETAEAEALLAAHLLETPLRDPLHSAAAFARLCCDHLLTEGPSRNALDIQAHDGASAPVDSSLPHGLSQRSVSPSPEHPSQRSDYLEPDAYCGRLKLLQLGGRREVWLSQYYRERAWPWLLSHWPQSVQARERSAPEGDTPWELDRPVQDIDWTASLSRSPVVVPGVTTLRQRHGRDHTSSHRQTRTPEGLDLYLDMSGSVPDPGQSCSPLVLAATILVLSALRKRLPVRVTGWSGSEQRLGTPWTRHAPSLLEALMHYPGGTTAFPLELLRTRYSQQARPSWVVLLSDEGGLAGLASHERKALTQGIVATGSVGAACLFLPADMPLPDWPELPAAGWQLQALGSEPQAIQALCRQWWSV
ncbi:MAG: hypothetical protein ACO1RX_10640 [Candidatus Sericytochromatia bacterium]